MITNFSKEKCLYILYDSLTNSVFQSQVLFPLIKQLEQITNLEVVLISFERHPISQSYLNSLPSHPRLLVYIEKRLPFAGRWTLRPLISFCKKIIEKHSINSLRARGPFAGYIAHHAHSFLPLRIHARGLCAEEFRFSITHTSPIFFKKLYNKIFYSRLYALERSLYSLKRPYLSIEVVSAALGDYLHTTFGTQKELLMLAYHDIPSQMSEEEKKQWRTIIRKKLGITDDTFVYCYSGSAHAWQCIDEMISYFQKDKRKHRSALFLILTCNLEAFENAIKKQGLGSHEICILKLSPSELHPYLCAADVGLLFRKRDIINWVARPTKMLEYKAARLPIIHNNTVQVLCGHHIRAEP